MPIKLKSCPFCGSKDIRIIWSETNFWKCSSCHLYFRNPMPTKVELDALYSHSWNNPEQHRSETSGTESHLANIYARYLARSLGIKDFSGIRVLDFGAGKGLMIKALNALGAEACAVEPYGYEYLRAQGIKVYRTLSEVKNSFDGITMIYVWEHLLQPWDILLELHRILVEDGWLFIVTPNPLGLNARLTKGKWRAAKKEGHLMFPTSYTIERILNDVGFRRFKRLKWFIRYHRFPRWMLDYLLQAIYLDGGLRYLAWK